MRILLADDEIIGRTLLEHWVSSWGYTVTCVSDGEAARAALLQDPDIGLVIADWMMPKLDGIELCKWLRSGAQEPYRYIVLLSARDNKADIVEGLEAGADDYLIKPCHSLELRMRLRAGARVVGLQRALVAARDELSFKAMHDSLTGVLNRGALVERLEQELARAARTERPLSVVMADLDHFKLINDELGHEAGDAVLIQVAARWRGTVRAYDSVGRMGGEEFLVVLPDCDAKSACSIGERLAHALRATPVELRVGSVRVTATFGVASTDVARATSAATLVAAADTALYVAKRAGRDRVLLAQVSDFPAEPTAPQADSAAIPRASSDPPSVEKLRGSEAAFHSLIRS